MVVRAEELLSGGCRGHDCSSASVCGRMTRVCARHEARGLGYRVELRSAADRHVTAGGPPLPAQAVKEPTLLGEEIMPDGSIGEAGVDRALSILFDEFERTMILAGINDVGRLDRRHVRRRHA